MRISYKRVRHISVQSNTPMNRVLRQAWALQYIQINQKHTRVINIDGKSSLSLPF